MQILRHLLPYNHDIVLFGDDHQGNLLRYGRGVEELKDFILSDPSRYCVHMGDEQEAFYIDDPRYDKETTTTSPLRQQKDVQNTYRPIKERMLAWLMGNHTYHLVPKAGNITQMTCEELNVPYGGYWCKVEICNEFGNPMYKIFVTHGSRMISSAADDPIRRRANMELALKRQLFLKAGDCLIMAKGHCHKLIVAQPRPALYLTTEEGEIKQHYTKPENNGYIPPENRYYVSTGSFLKTSEENVTSYAERAEYDPVELGYAVIEVRDGQVQKVYEKVI